MNNKKIEEIKLRAIFEFIEELKSFYEDLYDDCGEKIVKNEDNGEHDKLINLGNRSLAKAEVLNEVLKFFKY